MSAKLFKDTIHGFEAATASKTVAWMLIRKKCLEQKLEVPPYDKVYLVKVLTAGEYFELRKNKSTYYNTF